MVAVLRLVVEDVPAAAALAPALLLLLPLVQLVPRLLRRRLELLLRLRLRAARLLLGGLLLLVRLLLALRL